MANTTNLNLVKPAGTDKALVSVINSNSDKIDAWAGTTNQALTNINTAIAIEEIASSTSLATLIDNMTGYSQRHYFSVNRNRITDYPQVLIYSGANNYVTIDIEKRSATLARIKITASTSSDECVTAEGLFYNGTFYWSQLALKSDIPQYQVRTYSIDCTTLSNVGSKYIGTKDLNGLSEMTGVKAIVPLFARKSGYSYTCQVEFEPNSIRIQSDVSLEGVNVGVLFIY